MTNARRYTEEEIRMIFEEASKTREGEEHALAPAEGLTLDELQAIGREVGLSPARIADAADALEIRANRAPRSTSLGMPISVGRVVALPRAPTEREWELLVSELRQTFMATGRVGGSGNVRHWTNGNLHAYIEPTESGYHLRMGTLKGDAQPMNLGGGAAILFAIFLAAVLVLTGATGRELLGPMVIGFGGIGLLGTNLVRLPAWSRERAAQMEHIGNRALALLGEGEEPA